MSQFKINILYRFVDGPWGGGNQFLKNLRKFFVQLEAYEDNPEKADVILFNSHHCFKAVLRVKKNFPTKIFIHRIDGPVFLIRGKDRIIDYLIFKINSLVADGTVYQSKWSKNKCYEQGFKGTKFENIIINAPDSTIFSHEKNKILHRRKVKIIATSWSSNWKKGFEAYRYLDENLDFNKYEMTFVGNSPIQFKNIRHISPLRSAELAKELKMHDIFITASQKDPCSNSLLEALHCGLPAIALNDGGHPEIIGQAGEFFAHPVQIPTLIDKIIKNYEYYRNSINLPSLNDIGQRYFEFMQMIYDKVQRKQYVPKRLHIGGLLKINFLINWCRICEKWNILKTKVLGK